MTDDQHDTLRAALSQPPGESRTDYAQRLASMTDSELRVECNKRNCQSNFTYRNSSHDSHWKSHVCIKEVEKRMAEREALKQNHERKSL